MSLAHKGKKLSEEHKKNIGLGEKGEKHHFYGKNRNEETKRKISITLKGHISWNKGKRRSEETKRKISQSKKGIHHSEEVRRKISLAMKGEKSYWYGKNISEETKKKIREARKKQIFPLSNTKPELRFIELIEKYHLPYKYVGDGKFWIENINPDFIECNGKKIAVEIFGDYWHDPKQRKGLKFFQTEEGRKQILAKYGWKCIIIWEKELKDEQEVLKKIENFIHL